MLRMISPTLDSLDSIGLRHGTDKASAVHGFLSLYEGFLHPYRSEPLSVLEIGVHEGASVRTWEEYFPVGRIVGVDIRPEARRHASERIHIEIADQSDPQDLVTIGARLGPFDLILDDGSHLWEHQILSFQLLFPFVKPSRWYVLEDINTSFGIFVPDYQGQATTSAASYVFRLAEQVIAAGADSSPSSDPFIRSYSRAIEAITLAPKTCIMKKR